MIKIKTYSTAMVARAECLSWKHLAMCAAVVVALVVSTPAARGQENATITGVITDSTGAAIPNAQVTLTNNATGQVRKSISNDVGAYSFPSLNHGTYMLVVSATGFAKFIRTDIVVNVAQTVEANATLKIGTQAQSVTVQADALQVQTETSELSTLLTGQQMQRIATNGRNFVTLAALGLGVSANLPSFAGISGLGSATGIEFNGTRFGHNIYLLDGAELNDRGCGGCFVILPSQDAIAEFRTLDSNYSPDYGIGSGGTITLALKSGTRQYHGEVYETNRTTAYSANDYFNKQAGNPRPEFVLNEPGGNLGGPLFIPHVYNTNKARTFFFVNEEWRRLIQGSQPSVMNTVMASNFPTASQPFVYTLQPGDTAAPIVPNLPDNPSYTALEKSDGLTPGQPFPTNDSQQYVIPANMMDQNAVLEVNAGTFPKPNMPNGHQFVTSIPQPTYVREDAVRIDHTINSKLQLMGHLIHDGMKATYFPPMWTWGDYATDGNTEANPSYSAVIKLTQTITPNLLNETIFDYTGDKLVINPIAAPGASYTLPQSWTATSFFPVSQNAGHVMPSINLAGTPLGGAWTSWYPWHNAYEAFEYRDDLSWVHGNHQFKFGGGLLHDYKNQQLMGGTNGSATFVSWAFSDDSYINFMLGLASGYTQLNALSPRHWVNNNYFGYGLDNWHITPKLVLNLGLRYDAMPQAFERNNQFANFVPADYDKQLPYPLNPDGSINSNSLTLYNGEPFYLNGLKQAGMNGYPRGGVQNRYYTWEPRLGFAYNIFGNGKTVLRGGYAVFYERIQGNNDFSAATNPPFAYTPSATNVFFSDPNSSVLTGQKNQLNFFPASLSELAYRYPPPGTQEYQLGIQHQLANSVIMQIQYVGTDGWDQNDTRDINTLPQLDYNNPTNLYDLREGVAKGTLNANLYRQYPGYASIVQQENETNFSYNSFQAGIRIESRHGLTTQLAYTWSHLIDIIQNDMDSVSNPFDIGYDRGSDAGYDRRQIFNVSYIYDLPFFKHGNLLKRGLLGNWSISGITTAESGTPVVISYNGPDTVGYGSGFANRPNLVSKVKYPKTRSAWFSTSSFADPKAPWNGGLNNGFGSAGKDAVVGPGLVNWNIALLKSIPLSLEGPMALNLRFESFNTFNNVEWQGLDTGSHDWNFGQITSDYMPRDLEFGGSFTF